jgi:hypothetical protein
MRELEGLLGLILAPSRWPLPHAMSARRIRCFLRWAARSSPLHLASRHLCFAARPAGQLGAGHRPRVFAAAAVLAMRARAAIGDNAFHRMEEELDWLEMAGAG